MNYPEIVEYIKTVEGEDELGDNSAWLSFVRKNNISIQFPYIHITGSNNKENVSNYLFHIYDNGTYNVGYFTHEKETPYLERIKISGGHIPEASFTEIFNRYEKAIIDTRLSSFEILTLICITYFNEENVSLGIIETLLGGLYDPTNVPSNKCLLSIISSISLEHTDILGTSMSEIAIQKAGIIKERSKVLISKFDENATDIIRNECQKKQSELTIVDSYHFETYSDPHYRFTYTPYQNIEILSPSKSVLDAASLALETIKILQETYPIDEHYLRKSMERKPLPCRLEKLHNVFVDEGHNAEGIDSLMASLPNVQKDKKLHVLFATLRDKNISRMLSSLGKDGAEIVLTTFDNPNAKDEMDYFLYIADYSYQADWKIALSNLINTHKDDVILVTGSREFAYMAREYLSKVLHL